jgi:hypothetical protein
MPALDAEITIVDKEIQGNQSRIIQLNKDQSVDNEVYDTIKSTLAELSLERKVLLQNMQEAELKIERFSRLKNDYLNDISKFKA